MELVLVSSCLLGESVRHDGGDKRSAHPVLDRWLRDGRLVAVCPEVAGGLPVPRPPAEIAGGAGGRAVLDGEAGVFDDRGRNVTEHFIRGASHAAAVAAARGIRVAVLKEGSPSCGSSYVYDGTFASNRVIGTGVTTARLQAAGVSVFNELQLDEAADLLSRIESGLA